MNKKIMFFLLVAFAIIACEKQPSNNREGYSPKFVVEGWIEEGGYPYVMLTHNLPFFTAMDSAQLNEVVIRWAKVSVSDGTTTEILTGMKDNRYFPPYGYKGSEIKGEAGKTYTLKIEYAGNILTAETSIPQNAKLDSIWFTAKEEGLKQQLNVKFSDDAIDTNFYRLFTRTAEDEIFYPSLLSVQTDKYFNGKQFSLQVNRGPKNNLKIRNEAFFNTGDTVFVKFSAIPKSAYEFWSSFNDEVLNSSN
ncbi:MAG TPA: DUF4249 family protein, partial [Pelobium sp.]|nr:DUF4249 family protein [Pelobium sp.]